MFAMQINVFLRITGKRPDGFHDLASLFHVSIFVPVLFFFLHERHLKKVCFLTMYIISSFLSSPTSLEERKKQLRVFVKKKHV
jgi:hypothetical protein